MEMIKKYDLVDYYWDYEFKWKTYRLLDDPEIVWVEGNDYYVAKAVEVTFIDDCGSVPVFVIEKTINDEDTFFGEADNVDFRDEYIDINELANIEPFRERCEMLIAFHKKVEERKRRYGTVTYENEEYILIQDAMFEVDGSDNPYYCARAIKVPDFMRNITFPDKYGNVIVYEVQWDLKEEYYEDWKYRWECEDNGEPYNVDESKIYNADESDMCDWDKPCAVEDYDECVNVGDLDKWR